MTLNLQQLLYAAMFRYQRLLSTTNINYRTSLVRNDSKLLPRFIIQNDVKLQQHNRAEAMNEADTGGDLTSVPSTPKRRHYA